MLRSATCLRADWEVLKARRPNVVFTVSCIISHVYNITYISIAYNTQFIYLARSNIDSALFCIVPSYLF